MNADVIKRSLQICTCDPRFLCQLFQDSNGSLFTNYYRRPTVKETSNAAQYLPCKLWTDRCHGAHGQRTFHNGLFVIVNINIYCTAANKNNKQPAEDYRYNKTTFSIILYVSIRRIKCKQWEPSAHLNECTSFAFHPVSAAIQTFTTMSGNETGKSNCLYISAQNPFRLHHIDVKEFKNAIQVWYDMMVNKWSKNWVNYYQQAQVDRCWRWTCQMLNERIRIKNRL